MSPRTSKLALLRELYGVRADASLVAVQKAQQQLLKLEQQHEKIKLSLEAIQNRFSELNQARPIASELDVDFLQNEAATRARLESDSITQHDLLNTAQISMTAATEQLRSNRVQWQSHCNRLDALAKLESDSQLGEDLLRDAKEASITDEMAMHSHKVKGHG